MFAQPQYQARQDGYAGHSPAAYDRYLHGFTARCQNQHGNDHVDWTIRLLRAAFNVIRHVASHQFDLFNVWQKRSSVSFGITASKRLVCTEERDSSAGGLAAVSCRAGRYHSGPINRAFGFMPVKQAQGHWRRP